MYAGVVMAVSTSAPLTAKPGPKGEANCRPRASNGIPVKPSIGLLSAGRTAQRVTVLHTLFNAQAVTEISAESPGAIQRDESTSHSIRPRFALASFVTVSDRNLRTVLVVSTADPLGTNKARTMGWRFRTIARLPLVRIGTTSVI